MDTGSIIDGIRYRGRQFDGPISLMSPREMADLAARLQHVLSATGKAPAPDADHSSGRLASLVAARGGVSPVPHIECRHLDSRTVYDLCTHPVLLNIARRLYGDDLILWRSTFIEKAPGGPEFKWHQDWGGVYGPNDTYGLEPPILFTFWIAITEATEANGCLRFVPTLGHVIPAEPASSGARSTMLIPEGSIDETLAAPMPLLPGQCVVFSDRAVHASSPNRGDSSRLALAVRFTLPSVRVRPHFPGHASILVSGRDSSGFNVLQDPPDRDD